MADESYTAANGNEQYQENSEMYAEGTYENTAAGTGEAQADDGGDRINASKNEDDDRKIFVGGLSWETTIKDLRDFFCKYGAVQDCVIKQDANTGRSRGFGFVLFSESASVDKALCEKSHVLHGKNIDPKRAKARGGREPIKKVFVGGLDPDVPEDDIRDHFAAFGKIEEIDLPFDKQKSQRRAFCFITFESEEIVDQVVAEAKQTLGGKEVDVKKATPKSEQGRWNEGGSWGGNRGRGGSWGDRGDRGAGRGRGTRGGARGGNNGGSWGNQGYGGSANQGGYDYNNYYNQGYAGYGGYGGYGDYYNSGYGTGYDYNNYYSQPGWGAGYNQGYGGGYDYSGWYGNQGEGGQQQGSYGKQKSVRGGNSSGHGYHPYQRQ